VFAFPRAFGDIKFRFGQAFPAVYQRHHAMPVILNARVDPHDFQQCRHNVFQLAVIANPDEIFRMSLPPESKRDGQRTLIQAVVVEITVMVIQCFAVVGHENYQCFIIQAHVGKFLRDDRDAGVHIGDRPVVLRDDIVGAGAVRREPRAEIIAKRLERVYLIQRMIVLIV